MKDGTFSTTPRLELWTRNRQVRSQSLYRLRYRCVQLSGIVLSCLSAGTIQFSPPIPVNSRSTRPTISRCLFHGDRNDALRIRGCSATNAYEVTKGITQGRDWQGNCFHPGEKDSFIKPDKSLLQKCDILTEIQLSIFFVLCASQVSDFEIKAVVRVV
jgi:hypothetical protein